MSTSTTRLNVTKPASSENVSISIINSNYDLIDTAVGASIGASASRPASAFSGRLWYSTDSAKLYVNSAASASTAASWQDAVANALLSNVTVGGNLIMGGGDIEITRTSEFNAAYFVQKTGDSDGRYLVRADGLMEWGSGAATRDTNLYRSAANTLKTDDALVVAGGITSTGTVTASTSLNVGGDAAITGGLTVTGKGSTVYVRKSASESVISNTTLQNDDHITFTLAASAVYQLTARITVSGPAAADFKTAWAFTGAASGGNHTNRYCQGPSSTTTGVADTTAVARSTGWTTSVTYGVDGSLTSGIIESGLLDTAAGSGSITLQWAQNSSVATSTAVNTSTYAILERLA
jgi:hypothetical protein